ncbi:mucin-5AC-like [Lineus longissimus]|uniref:mucin-5AC-like n=1 Tax=Lineus longissimus TaxID=88925 RepID=UPI00315DB832
MELLFLTILLFLDLTGAEILRDVGCSGQTIIVSCNNDQIVRIITANYYQKKAKPSWKCRQSAYYAALTALDDAVPQCNSKPSCAILVPMWLVGVWQGQNYMEIEYECIPKLPVFDLCTDITKPAAASGYIITPGYPSVVHGNTELLECRCKLASNKDISIKQLEGSLPGENFLCNKYKTKTDTNSTTTMMCDSAIDDVWGALHVEVVMLLKQADGKGKTWKEFSGKSGASLNVTCERVKIPTTTTTTTTTTSVATTRLTTTTKKPTTTKRTTTTSTTSTTITTTTPKPKATTIQVSLVPVIQNKMASSTSPPENASHYDETTESKTGWEIQPSKPRDTKLTQQTESTSTFVPAATAGNGKSRFGDSAWSGSPHYLHRSSNYDMVPTEQTKKRTKGQNQKIVEGATRHSNKRPK